MKKIRNIAGNLTVILYLVCTVCFLGLPAAGIRPYIVLSGSMEPAVKTGSLCFVDVDASYEEVQTGDVAAFESAGGSPAAHRVIRITEEGIETKGDANRVSDGVVVTETNYLGKVLFSVPYAGYVCDFFQTRYGMILVAAGLAAGWLFRELYKTIKTGEKVKVGQ